MRLPAAVMAFCALLIALPLAAVAHEYKVGGMVIVNPHAISLVPGRPIDVYMTVENNSGSIDRIIDVYVPHAEKAELHTSTMSGNVMQMQQVEEIDIPANGKVELKPGGYHIVLFGLAGTLKPGDRIPMEIEFEFAGRANIEAVVTKPAAADMSMSGSSNDSPTQ